MGTGNSKKSAHIPVFASNTENKKTGDIMNESLLQFCISHNTADIISVIESGADLTSPYKGVPLIFSATLALLHDADFDRFKENWKVVGNISNYHTCIPILRKIQVGLTNFTKDNIRLRDSCYPVIHVNSLTKDLVDTEYKHHRTVLMCETENADMRKVLISVMSTIRRSLKFLTDGNENVDCVYKDTPTEKCEEIIRRNAKYIIDNINILDTTWDKVITAQIYADRYKDNYSVDNIVDATFADTNTHKEPSK